MTDLRSSSVAVIRGGQHASGGYVAAPTFPPYRYVWVRDGAFIAHAMDAVGEHDSAEAFHRFVSRTIERHGHKVEALEKTRDLPEGIPPDEVVLHTRFTADGEEGQEPWSNFQLDGYGLWLTSLALHLDATGADAEPHRQAVELTARYLARLWDRPCWSCWEEFPERRHPTTIAAVASGLGVAAGLLGDDGAAEVGHRAAEAVSGMTTLGALARSEHSTEVDASALFVLGRFGPFADDEELRTATVDRIETDLVADGGGVHRYLSDTFYGGGLWLPLAGALAWVSAGLGRTERATEILAWIEGAADPEGRLPEQVPRHLLHPQMRNTWVDRWGPEPHPLLWSHAMYLLAGAAAG